MANAEFIGSALIARWYYEDAGGTCIGTVNLSTDFRNFTYTPSIELVDVTAGADAYRHRAVSYADGQVTCTQLFSSNIGTADLSGLSEGTKGSLLWSPAGTAAGLPKFYADFICLGSTLETPYDNVVSITTTWQQDGERTDTVWS